MKLPYFKLGEALSDIRDEFAYGTVFDKASAVAKFTGKTVANVGMLVVETGVHIVTNPKETSGVIAESTLKNGSNLTEEQRSKLNEVVENGRQAKQERYMEEAKRNREMEEAIKARND